MTDHFSGMLFRRAAWRDDICDLLSVLVGRRTGLVMTLRCFFDESERDDGQSSLCVAGYAFKPVAYKQFCRRWAKMLSSAGVDHFHTTDLVAGHGVFRGLPISVRQQALAAAVEAVNQHTLAGLGCLFDRDEFERAVPEEWVHMFGSIYAVACQMSLQVAGYWLKKHNHFDPVSYFFENGHKFEKEADALFFGLAKNLDFRSFVQYRSHAFVDKTCAYGLQAADLIAWTVARAHTRQRANSPLPNALRPFKDIITGLTNRGDDRHYVPRYTGDLLRRFIAEQADHLRTPGLAVPVGPRKKSLR